MQDKKTPDAPVTPPRKRYREWYAKNKDRVSKRKAARYQNDPEYREKIKERARAWRRKEREKRKSETKVPLSEKPPVPHRVEIGGTVQRAPMFTIGKAAHYLGLSTQTLRKWEAGGVLPPVDWRTAGGHRLYTGPQLEELKRLYDMYREEVSPWRITEEFVEDVRVAWGALLKGIRPEEME